MRYASAVSPITPERAPIEASAPYAGLPAAVPMARGSDMAIAARVTAAQGMGAGCGLRERTSQSGGVRGLREWFRM
ncbi:hypothetical protein GCM10010349_48030 [Streptomyces flavofungini]|nr:hypothetical protein GCM10010349_48030 [Streptomyces flavofungini]